MSSKWDQYKVSPEVSEQVPNKWDQYKQETISPEVSISPKSEQIAKQSKFFGYQPSPETIESVRQNVGSSIKKLTGGLVGSPGDILSFAQSLMGVEKPKEFLPTSETIEKGFEKISGEKFKPTGTMGEIAATGSGFLGSILGLGGPLKGATILKTLVRTGLAAFVPASVLTGAEKAGLPSWAQAALTIGSSLLTHKITGKSMNQIKTDLYKKADTLAKDTILPASNLMKQLDSLGSKMSEGLTTGPKARIRTMIEEIKGKISGEVVPVKDLLQFRRDINEVGKEFTKDQLRGSENYWRGLRTAIDNSIGEFEKINPEFSKTYRQANSLHRGLNEGQAIEKFILSSPVLKGATAGAEVAATIMGHGWKGPIAAGGLKIGEFLAALARNPGYRKAWQDVLIKASKEEARGTINALKRFHKMSENEGIIENSEN